MDLRKFSLTKQDIDLAQKVLNYQPFIISDDIFSGVAYSWLYDEDGGKRVYSRNEFVFNRNECSPELFEKAGTANHQLRLTYDSILDAVAERFQGCSFSDMACNNGYFVIGAALRGMTSCTGLDAADYSESVEFLSRITNVEAKFIQSYYDSWRHWAEDFEMADVVLASQVMQHISDPLYFLSFVASRARKALVLFMGMGDTDNYQVYYQDPNRFYPDKPFPIGFDNDVGISKGLLFKSLDLLGFDEIVEIPRRDEWLPQSWWGSQKILICIRNRPYFTHHPHLTISD
jgi:SAM-dependent methyltransferase